jgi:AAA+ superfamily predicted ATPase
LSTVANAVGIADEASPAALTGGLMGALEHLDERLRAAVHAATAAYGPQAVDDPHRGLFIGEEEVGRLLARTPCVPFLGPAAGEPSLVADIDTGSPLTVLARAFKLEPLDLEIVLVALAPELDLRYERLYGFLQDDVTRRRPGVDFALNLLCADAGEKLAARARFAFDAPLRRHRLLELRAPPHVADPPLLSQELRLDDQVVRMLLGEHGLDPRLGACARLELEPRGSLGELADITADVASLGARATAARASASPLRLAFDGRPGSGRSRVAAALAGDLGVPLLAADLPRTIAQSADAALRLELLVREARLHDAVLLLSGVDALGAGDRGELDLLLRLLEAHPGIVVVSGSQQFAPTRTQTLRRPASFVRVAFPLPSAASRVACWRDRLSATGIDAAPETVTALGNRFRLTCGQIADAVAVAAELAVCEPDSGATPSRADLFAAARAQSAGALDTLAQKVAPRRRLADIVLPADHLAQLRDILNTVKHRALVYDEWGFGDRLSLGKGLNVLFSGASGTGKTLAAEILATELEMELFKIDLSSVVSKYIGETEKNLGRIFAEAQTTSAILFFDEADALFGKRSEVKDAHDRYANIEVGYLLQQIEEYDGTVILATNLMRNMDTAFMRRMHFTLEFPLPDEADRLRIWRAIWPPATPLDDDLDLSVLARHVVLSGGHIRNIALAAAFLGAEHGAVTMDHVALAARREYQKLGQVVPGKTIER